MAVKGAKSDAYNIAIFCGKARLMRKETAGIVLTGTSFSSCFFLPKSVEFPNKCSLLPLRLWSVGFNSCACCSSLCLFAVVHVKTVVLHRRLPFIGRVRCRRSINYVKPPNRETAKHNTNSATSIAVYGGVFLMVLMLLLVSSIRQRE